MLTVTRPGLRPNYAATARALIDYLIERGLNPVAPLLFIIDGSKALSKAIRATFGG